jgi:hypothetical protein
MRILHKVLAIVAFLILAVQTTRNAYQRWVEPRTSVLDRYDRPLQADIANAKSLDELVARYEPVRKAADEKRKEIANSPNAAKAPVNLEEEPFKSETQLHMAIEDWERNARELRQLKLYWLLGLAFFVAGALIYRFSNGWLGTTLLIVAFAEFIYWTEPGSRPTNMLQADQLLTERLILSVISFVLLLVAIRVLRVFEPQSSAKTA